MKKRDVLKPWLIFRDAETGRYVTRLYALMNPKTTVGERRSKFRSTLGDR